MNTASIKFQWILLCVILLLWLFMPSCRVLYPNELLKSTDDYYYFQFKDREINEHIIRPQDELTLQVYARSGFQLVDVLQQGGITGRVSGSTDLIRYLVRENGFVELPILGDIYVVGLTRKELEDMLEEMYSRYFNEPFIMLRVVNRRAFVFMGIGEAKIVDLPYEKTTLLEVIALAGGIPPGAKSHKIRIIRGDYKNPEILHVDLSKISGLPDAGITIMSNDIIVVEPVKKLAPEILSEITPILSLITTILTFYLLIRNLGN